jgi:hypothetical protein
MDRSPSKEMAGSRRPWLVYVGSCGVVVFAVFVRALSRQEGPIMLAGGLATVIEVLMGCAFSGIALGLMMVYGRRSVPAALACNAVVAVVVVVLGKALGLL